MHGNAVYAVFDIESNGQKGTSVLSASSIVCSPDGQILDFFNRFYFPQEAPNPQAFQIHGLSPERIACFRRMGQYAPYFLDDCGSLAAFWDQWDVQGIAVHNLQYDTSFLPPIPAFTDRSWWCSMLGLVDFCRIPGKFNKFKWPALKEAADEARNNCPGHQKLADIENLVGSPISHFGLSDCFELYGLFVRIIRNLPRNVSFAQIKQWKHEPPRAATAAVSPAPMKDRFVTDCTGWSARLADAANQPQIAAALRALE